MKALTAVKLANLKSVLRKLVIVFLASIVIFNLYLITVQLLLKNELPKFFGYAQVIVISGSMQPEIEVGDLLIIHEQQQYAVNDIITYRSGASFVTHRIIAVNANELITQGDANNVADPVFALSQAEGKVVLRLPGVGKLIYFLKTERGIYFTALLAILLFALPYTVDAFKQYKRNKPKQ